MMTLIHPRTIRKYMSVIGYNTKPPYGIKLRGLLFIMLSMCLFWLSINAMIDNWDNMASRFLAIEHASWYLIFTILLCDFAFKPGHLYILLDAIEKDFYTYDSGIYSTFKDERKRILSEMIKEENAFSNILTAAIKIEGSTQLTSPVFILLYRLFIKKEVIDVKNFPLPLSHGYGHKDLAPYVATYAVEIIYLIGAALLSYSVHSSCILTTRCLAADVKLFTTAIRHIDMTFNNQKIIFDKNVYSADLKNAFRHLILHQQIIYRH